MYLIYNKRELATEYLREPALDPVKHHQNNETQIIPIQPFHSSAPECDPSQHPGSSG
jgi:hypothetical protein